MDPNNWSDSIVQVLLLLLAVHILTSAVIGCALASYGRFALWIGGVCSVVVPVVGPVVLLIVALTRASQNSNVRAMDASGRACAEVMVESSPDNPWAIAGSGFSTDGTVATMAAPVTSFSAADPWDLGPASPHSDAPQQSTKRTSSPRGTVSRLGAGPRLLSHVTRLDTPSGSRSIIILGVIIVATALTLTQCWLVFDPTILPPLSFFAHGTVLEAAIALSIILFLAGLVLALIRPSRWASVLVSSVGGTWLFLAGVGLILVAPVTAMLEKVGEMSHSVGDFLTNLGIDAGSATVTLPNGMDLSAFGIDKSQLSLAAVDLAAPVPTATLELGPALFLALAVGVFALAWAIMEIRAAHRHEVVDRNPA